MPKFLKPESYHFETWRLFRAWSKFLRQIPREFRSSIKSHQHFIVLGNEKSGKSSLIHNMVEQSQNIYPFEVEYTQDPDIKFYLGAKQIIEEVSVALLKDRTINSRKNLVHLWKHLYAKTAPVIVVTYPCLSDTLGESQGMTKLAHLIAGKLSLLSEMTKESLQVRIACTYMDRIEGYLEFAKFIKQHNIAFEIPLTSNFESAALERELSAFRDKYLSLILTSTSADDFVKILNFFAELPSYFSSLEEFLRALTIGNVAGQIKLEKLTFITQLEPHTSYSLFDWTPPPSRSIFFRHPMLKHQLASGLVALFCSSFILNNFVKDKHQYGLAQRGVDALYVQPKLFVHEIVPQLEKFNQKGIDQGYLRFLPHFYKNQIQKVQSDLAVKMEKNILEPHFRSILINEKSEIDIVYMLGLIHATRDNRVGDYILKHLSDWSHALKLDEQLIKSYILNSSNASKKTVAIQHLDKINISLPLTDLKPWISFFSQFQEIVDQPVFTGHSFNDIRKNAHYLLTEYRKFKNDAHVCAICNLLKELDAGIAKDFRRNIQVLTWMNEGENSSHLESFLVFVCQSCPQIPDISDLNVSQFFAKVKEIASLTEKENRTYPFLIEDQKFFFESKKWVDLSVGHIIERLIQNYIVVNNDTQGDIFFKNTPVLPDIIFESYRNEFPSFTQPVVIHGRYSRLAFEKNVRYTSESLLGLLETLPLNREDKDRFTKFVQQEVLSYAKQYQKEYERAYAGCDIRATSLEEVKETLAKILEPSSSFHHFLNTINHHTAVFSDPTTCFTTLDEMNHFNFLKPLMSQLKNKQSPFELYQSLLREALSHLKTDKQAGSPFTPSAQIALSLLKQSPDSYLNLITEHLSEIGVPSRYHNLFTAPIMQIYHIGVKDLQKGIDRLWTQTYTPQASLLFAKRPFNSTGEMVATFEEVKQMTSPKSEIWQMIRNVIAPVSIVSNGIWAPKPACDVQLSSQFYSDLNRLARVTTALWDNEGNPQALTFNVQFLPFSASSNSSLLPIQSYIVAGKEALHNFNQSPTWHPLKIEWWKEDSSTVVIELMSKNDTKSYRAEKVLNTLWSFFELLKKGEKQEKSTWVWKLGNDFNDGFSQAAICFEKNPLDLFDLQTNAEEL